MLPILPAHARTGHSIQGYTASNGIVDDVGSNFFAGEYVAISRATCIEDIIVLMPLQEKHFTSHSEYRLKVHLEYRRLALWFPQT